ncbi:MAG: pyridoxamine 5'-phosphate oxidase [Gammaproteobacteria bacterium]
MDISGLRTEYERAALRRQDLSDSPVEQFSIWFDDARAADLREPNAMSLATTGADAQPSLRTVLMKYFDQDGFVFFTNLESAKARQIADNSKVALLFYWQPLERQIIIRGVAEKVTHRESLAYFMKRPHASQLGAWVSDQSRVITSRKMLEMKFQQMKQKFSEGKVPLPSFWGGYRVRPQEMEFWQGRPSRLHDRFVYRRGKDDWRVERLAP